MRNRFWFIVWFIGLLLAVGTVHAQQRIRIPNNAVIETFQQGSVTNNPLTPIPQLGAPAIGTPSATLGQPTFDPYSLAPNASSVPPSLMSPPNASPYTGSPTTPFWQTPTAPTYPQAASPNISGVVYCIHIPVMGSRSKFSLFLKSN